MALIIHKAAQERLHQMGVKLSDAGFKEPLNQLYALILWKAVSLGAIDSGSPQCEGEPSKFDLIVFPESFSLTGFEWVLWDKSQTVRDPLNGGFICHDRWFKNYMEGQLLHEACQEVTDHEAILRGPRWQSHT